MNNPIITLRFKMLLVKIPFITAFITFATAFLMKGGTEVIKETPWVLLIFLAFILFFLFFFRSFDRYRIFVFEDKVTVKDKKEIEVYFKEVHKAVFEVKQSRDSDGDTSFIRHIVLKDVYNNTLIKLDFQVFSSLIHRKHFFEILLENNPNIQLDERCELIKEGEFFPFEKLSTIIKYTITIGFTVLILFAFFQIVIG